MESISTAVVSLVKNIILSVTDLEAKRKSKKPINVPYEFCKINYFCLTKM